MPHVTLPPPLPACLLPSICQHTGSLHACPARLAIYLTSTCLPAPLPHAHLPACPPTSHPPACLPPYLTPTCLPAHTPLPACPPACLLPCQVLFATTETGSLRTYKYPLSGEFQEIKAHASQIQRMRVSWDEQLLVTTSDDGCVFIYDVRDKDAKAVVRWGGELKGMVEIGAKG